MNTFAGAYYYAGEPMYERLACLFGMDDVKLEGQNEVVVISDTTEKVHCDDLMNNEAGEEEVNSPVVFPGPKVRRKLFDDVPEPNDRESTTVGGIDFIDLTTDGQMCTRVSFGKELRKPPVPSKGGAGPSTLKSPNGSSCGSNSPIVTRGWPHNIRRP